MGAVAPILGTIATVGLSAYAANKMMSSMNDQSSALSALSTQNAQTALDTVPDAPVDIDSGENDEAEAARLEQQQLAAANEASVSTTGGLGLTTQANTKKKTLGGAT